MGGTENKPQTEAADGEAANGGQKFVGHDVALNLAKDCLKSGDLEHARQILEGIVKLEPDCFEALLQLAFVSDVDHDQAGFERWLDKALAANPRHAQAWIYKGMC